MPFLICLIIFNFVTDEFKAVIVSMARLYDLMTFWVLFVAEYELTEWYLLLLKKSLRLCVCMTLFIAKIKAILAFVFVYS